MRRELFGMQRTVTQSFRSSPGCVFATCSCARSGDRPLETTTTRTCGKGTAQPVRHRITNEHAQTQREKICNNCEPTTTEPPRERGRANDSISYSDQTSARPINVTLALGPSSPSPSAAASNVHIVTKIPKQAVHLRSHLSARAPS